MPLPGGSTARARFTTRADGDFRAVPPAVGLLDRRRSLIDGPWSSVTQAHGAGVVVVEDPSSETAEADALVTDRAGVVLSVNVADCAPVAIVSRQHMVAVVHAGWRGLVAGIVEATVGTLRLRGAVDLTAWLGPCVHPECYEFGTDDLNRLVSRFGPAVRTRTSSGTPAFDLPMAVAAALGGVDVALVSTADCCTACDEDRYYSYRARGDAGRHALAVWIDP